MRAWLLLGMVLLGTACGSKKSESPAHIAEVPAAPAEVAPAPEGEDAPAGGDAAGTRPAGSGEDFGPAGEPKPAAGPVGDLVDGGACLRPSDCQSGVCEGQGCTDDAPGVCVPRVRACTKDLRTYCACAWDEAKDDKGQFYGSGSCPDRRYAFKGDCPLEAP